jgi:hypothetical protein
MDAKGNVVGFDGQEFRIKMRGPELERDVTFVDAWVAPNGDVFAVTEDEVYKLE